MGNKFCKVKSWSFLESNYVIILICFYEIFQQFIDVNCLPFSTICFICPSIDTEMKVRDVKKNFIFENFVKDIYLTSLMIIL